MHVADVIDRQSQRLSPHGESGLKYVCCCTHKYAAAGLSPHGESGLKCSFIEINDEGQMSLPTRGEWVEIDLQGR